MGEHLDLTMRELQAKIRAAEELGILVQGIKAVPAYSKGVMEYRYALLLADPTPVEEWDLKIGGTD